MTCTRFTEKQIVVRPTVLLQVSAENLQKEGTGSVNDVANDNGRVALVHRRLRRWRG
jgi:hypothetical protein